MNPEPQAGNFDESTISPECSQSTAESWVQRTLIIPPKNMLAVCWVLPYVSARGSRNWGKAFLPMGILLSLPNLRYGAAEAPYLPE